MTEPSSFVEFKANKHQLVSKPTSKPKPTPPMSTAASLIEHIVNLQVLQTELLRILVNSGLSIGSRDVERAVTASQKTIEEIRAVSDQYREEDAHD